MSALGHKRTFAVQNRMSALPLKADIVCDKIRIMKPVTIAPSARVAAKAKSKRKRGVWAFHGLMPRNNPNVVFISTRPINDKDA